jgi:hypothetical protein
MGNGAMRVPCDPPMAICRSHDVSGDHPRSTCEPSALFVSAHLTSPNAHLSCTLRADSGNQHSGDRLTVSDGDPVRAAESSTVLDASANR